MIVKPPPKIKPLIIEGGINSDGSNNLVKPTGEKDGKDVRESHSSIEQVDILEM